MRTVRLYLLAPSLWAALVLLVGTILQAFPQNFADVKPSPQQSAWQDLEFGVIIHFGTNTFLDKEWGDGSANPQVFNPTRLDTEQWMTAIQQSGAKYVILVAKHHDGFCLWPSTQTDYSIKQSPWHDGHGDVVREVAEAARRHHLKFGVYLSPWDRHDTRYADPAAYDRYYLAQLEELATHYGDLVEFWLDGAGSEGRIYDFKKIIEHLRTYQPNTLVFSDVSLFQFGDLRWAGNEEGHLADENWNVLDRAGFMRWRPVESDIPLHRMHWFWHPHDQSSLRTVPQLMKTYESTVGRGAQLLIGVAPNRDGLIEEEDVERLRELGKSIQSLRDKNIVPSRHTQSSSPDEAALDGNPDTFWSAPLNSHSAILQVEFDRPVTFNRSITMEWLNEGQNVQKYSIEAWDGQHWRQLVTAQAIGHLKLDRFEPVTSARVRLNILSSVGEAHIREFQLYNDQP
jgi:alpha-L-fucosidase